MMLSARPIIFVVTTECKLIFFGFVSINTTFKEFKKCFTVIVGAVRSRLVCHSYSFFCFVPLLACALYQGIK